MDFPESTVYLRLGPRVGTVSRVNIIEYTLLTKDKRRMTEGGPRCPYPFLCPSRRVSGRTPVYRPSSPRSWFVVSQPESWVGRRSETWCDRGIRTRTGPTNVKPPTSYPHSGSYDRERRRSETGSRKPELSRSEEGVTEGSECRGVGTGGDSSVQIPTGHGSSVGPPVVEDVRVPRPKRDCVTHERLTNNCLFHL